MKKEVEEKTEVEEKEESEVKTSEKVSKKSAAIREKHSAVDEIIDELELKVSSGNTDRMNEIKGELLSAKIKIKRLIS